MLLAGGVAAFAGWWALRAPLANPVLLRPNYRGEAIPTAIGVVAIVGYVGVVAVCGLLDALTWTDDPVAATSRNVVLVAVLGFGLLGLFDDLAGSGHRRGFAGHAAALRAGQLTTGMLKLVGGALVAVAVVSAVPRRPQAGWLLLDAALVALAANLANLLDRAPGRTTKVALVALAVLAVGSRKWSELAGSALAVGAAAGLLAPELRERGMVGDTGANAVGAAVGLGVVLTLGQPARAVVLAVLLALNLASERVSFTRVIDATPPLRWFDRLGRRRAD